MSKYQIGERVTIDSPDMFYHGIVGVIESIRKAYDGVILYKININNDEALLSVMESELKVYDYTLIDWMEKPV